VGFGAQGKIFLRHAETVVGDTDGFKPPSRYFDAYFCRSRVYRIVEQFPDNSGWAVYHLAGGNLPGYFAGENTYGTKRAAFIFHRCPVPKKDPVPVFHRFFRSGS